MSFNFNTTATPALTPEQRDQRTLRQGRNLDPQRNTIDLGEDQSRVHAQIARALSHGPESATVFSDGDRLVELVREDGRMTTQPLSDAQARVRLHQSASVVVSRRGEQFPAPAPLPALQAGAALAVRQAPRLERVVRWPELRGGRIIATAGYDPEARTFYDLPDTFEVPASATQADAADAAESLRQLHRETAWEDEDLDLAGWVGLCLTACVKAEVGPTPVAILTANGPGVGKTALADSVPVLLTGSRTSAGVGYTAHPDKQANWLASALTQLQRRPEPLMLADNLGKGSEIQGDALAAAATSDRIDARRLGFNDQHLTARVAAPLVFTGNNISAGEDMRRRAHTIRLSWAGNGMTRTFEGAPLVDQVRDRRTELLSALLTILQAWLDAGQPAPTSRAMLSFERWHHTVAGALEFAGLTGFLARMDEEQEARDTETDLWLEHLALLRDLFGDDLFTVREALEALRTSEDHDADTLPMPPGVSSSKVGNVAQRLGIAYRKVGGRFFGHVVLESAGAKRDGVVRWRVRSLADEQEAAA